MINNLIKTSFYTSDIITESLASRISNLSKRDKLIGMVAFAALTLYSLYWICKKIYLRDDLAAKPLDPKDDLNKLNVPDIINTPQQKIDTPPQKIDTPPQKIETPHQDKKPEQTEEPQKIEEELTSGLFDSIRDEFDTWLTHATKTYPTQYSVFSHRLIMINFDAAKSEGEFFRAIDSLTSGQEISEKSANLIKSKFKKLNPPAKLPDNDADVIFPPEDDTFLEWNAPPLDIPSLGMRLDHNFDSFPQISDDIRFGTRDLLIQEISKHLNIDASKFEENVGAALQIIEGLDVENLAKTNFLFSNLEYVRLFTKKGALTSDTSNENYLLGRFDVLALPCTMDYSADWQANPPGQNYFLVHHGAAINIGESARSADYQDYSLADKSLDKKKYLKDMGSIFYQMLAAQKFSGSTEAVWFPFGMGAFLRNLHKMDPAYADPQRLANLKQEIAAEFVKQTLNFPTLHIHMCLPLDNTIGSESHQNYNAFVQAFADQPTIHDRVSFHINADATGLAQWLANQSRPVSLANGANRNLIGNHWFQGKARIAIDENFHRRSLTASMTALILNNGIETVKRTPNELADRVKHYKGNVTEI